MNTNLLTYCTSDRISEINNFPEDVSIAYASMYAIQNAKWSMFGLQIIMKMFLEGKAFSIADVYDAESFWNTHTGAGYFPTNKWLRLYDKHQGTLPIAITAYGEGKNFVFGTPFLNLQNTDPEFPWLVSYLEGVFNHLTTFMNAAQKYGYVYSEIENMFAASSEVKPTYHLYDEGGGSNSLEATATSAAHLLYFAMSDNKLAAELFAKYYNSEKVAIGLPQTQNNMWGYAPFIQLEDFRKYNGPTIANLPSNYSKYDTSIKVNANLMTEIKDDEINVFKIGRLGSRQNVVGIVGNLMGLVGVRRNDKNYRVLSGNNRLMIGNVAREYSVSHFSNLFYEQYATENLIIGIRPTLFNNEDRQTMVYGIVAVENALGVVTDIVSSRSANANGPFLTGRAGGDNNGILCALEQSAHIPIFLDGKILKEYTFEDIHKR